MHGDPSVPAGSPGCGHPSHTPAVAQPYSAKDTTLRQPDRVNPSILSSILQTTDELYCDYTVVPTDHTLLHTNFLTKNHILPHLSGPSRSEAALLYCSLRNSIKNNKKLQGTYSSYLIKLEGKMCSTRYN